MSNTRTEMLVGVFAIMIFALLTFMTFRVGDFTLGKSKGYTLYVSFENTTGLDIKTKVKIAGVDSGTIEKIYLQDGLAIVQLRMDSEIQLYSDATAQIKSTGLLGDKYLEVGIGLRPPMLKEDDYIVNVIELVEIDDLLQHLTSLSGNISSLVASINKPEIKDAMRETVMNLKDITENMDDLLTENKGRLNNVFASVESLTMSLDEIVKANKQPLSNTIANLNEFSRSLKDNGPEMIANLNEAISELKRLLSESGDDVQKLVRTSTSTMESIQSITQKIERGEGTIGKLINDDKLYTSLTNTISSVEKAISSIDRFKTYITFKGEYLTGVRDTRGAVYLTLQPRKDKYYILGVISDPLGKSRITETTTDGVTVRKEKFTSDVTFTAQFAKRYRDTALRIGVTQNTFGVGADQFLLGDKLKVSVDAWDFGTDEVGAESPHLNIGADYFMFKHLFISAGLENILNSKRFGASVGGGLKFEDEDLKYLMGSAPSLPIR